MNEIHRSIFAASLRADRMKPVNDGKKLKLTSDPRQTLTEVHLQFLPSGRFFQCLV